MTDSFEQYWAVGLGYSRPTVHTHVVECSVVCQKNKLGCH